MRIYDIDILERGSDGLYDLVPPTFYHKDGVALRTHIVSREEEMRVDLISYNIYGTTDNVAFLLHLNDIVNPLNIMEGDIIYWASEQAIDEMRPTESFSTTDRATLLGNKKETRQDNNRQRFLENGYKLPPVYMDTPTSSVRIEGNDLVI